MIKRYEITDLFDGRSLGYLERVSTRRLARKVAQNRANEIGNEISLHEVGRYGARTLIQNYHPESAK